MASLASKQSDPAQVDPNDQMVSEYLDTGWVSLCRWRAFDEVCLRGEAQMRC